MLSAAFLIAAAGAPCDVNRDIATARPAALPAAYASRYPNGVDVTLRATAGADGKTISVKSYTDEAPLRAVTAAWAKHVMFVRADSPCTPTEVRLDNVDFYPAASGVVGRPMIVGGVNFGAIKYTRGPGNCSTVPSSGDGYEGTVEDVFSGLVAGQRVAVAILRCEYNGHGFDQTAQAFSVGGGKATSLGTLGRGGMGASDSPMPPMPGGWFHVSFLNGRLYTDVWSMEKCKAAGGWVSSAYTMRAGKLVLLGATRHHRQGIDPVCSSF